MRKVTEDRHGNDSSMRLMFIIFIIALTTFLAVWMGVFVRESFKDVSNYDGLSSILWGGATGGGIVFLAKALQTFFEK
jgi:uncharacterized membrane protein